jgi:hypothetical protein
VITFQLEAECCAVAPQQLLASSSPVITIRWNLANSVPSSTRRDLRGRPPPRADHLPGQRLPGLRALGRTAPRARRPLEIFVAINVAVPSLLALLATVACKCARIFHPPALCGSCVDGACRSR